VERFLPLWLFSWLLWPPAALWGLIDFRNRQRAFAAWQNLRGYTAVPSRARLYYWHCLQAPHARSAYLFPDRLSEPRWQRRLRLTTATNLKQLLANDHRLIFVSLHFGPFDTLVYWLRARGIRVTVLVGQAAPRQRLKQRQYALSPPCDLPVVLPVSELRHALDHRFPSRHFMIMMDVDRGHQVEVEVGQLAYRVAAGAVRLARSADALLVPCLATALPGLRFAIHIGEPFPAKDGEDVAVTTRRLLEQLLPIVRQNPEQSGYRLVSATRPLRPVPLQTLPV
jgi:hypothetical protein